MASCLQLLLVAAAAALGCCCITCLLRPTLVLLLRALGDLVVGWGCGFCCCLADSAAMVVVRSTGATRSDCNCSRSRVNFQSSVLAGVMQTLPCFSRPDFKINVLAGVVQTPALLFTDDNVPLGADNYSLPNGAENVCRRRRNTVPLGAEECWKLCGSHWCLGLTAVGGVGC